MSDGAISLFQEALEKLPNHPIINYHLGMAYFKKKEKELAKKFLTKALNINQKSPQADEAKQALKQLKE
ncbi:MAG: hypothetical protein KIIPBIDF_00370 [Candidatus Methanoperedenaceae archaeon GB50]|nr:MAG: hypothetical protein KIIPBIDF_00370 [Candidatus Methanoperedenaceae archaeon GB50]